MTQRPSLQIILTQHIIAMFLLAMGGTMASHIIPLIALLRFSAAPWQSLLITTSLPAFLLASIFWNDFFQRVSVQRYLIVHWFAAILPFALMGLAQNYWHMLALQILAAAGAAGLQPISGALLKRFYSDANRGRMYGLITLATLASGIVSVWIAGNWLQANGDAFRIFLPAMALLEAAGVALLIRLDRQTDTAGQRTFPPRRPWRDVLAPIWHMHEILRADRTFFRYEAAFMTYGIGFAICEGLLPILVTDGLRLEYAEVAEYAHVVMRSAMFVCMLPMGWVIDRIGAVRTSAISFAALALYPIGLMFATSATGLAIASACYGAALAGVMQGWMLGPVSLAPKPEQVPHYVSIHTTLVGVRGVFAQALGVGLYEFFGSFRWPLLLAITLFVWGASQMWRLPHAKPNPPAEIVEPTAHDAETA